ncbi:MAG TPA: diguanylate cyclase [Terriglobales bacterium]|nr:diguanylate cyclase [Terriglobales bacterium]
MSEIAKRLERAEKYLQKGKLTSALEEFREVIREDPSNDSARQRAADLCLSLDLSSEACCYLGDIFDHAVALGRSPEAINTYKKLARLTSPGIERTFKYAQLIERSSPREALDSLKSVFQAYITNGDRAQAMQTIKRIVSLEPCSENLKREADLAVAMGDNRSAALSFLQLGRMEEDSGRDGAAMFERAYSLDPENPTAGLSHARCLLRDSRAEQAVEVLQTVKLDTTEYLELFANALLLANQPENAEPVITRYYKQSPGAMPLIGEVLNSYIYNGKTVEAIHFAREIEPEISKRGDMRDFLGLVNDLVQRQNPGVEFLEYLAQLFNTANREHEYCDTLLKLFELHFANRNYMKAAECLDRASEVDAYEPGHEERLELLRGKIDSNRFNSIANRITTVTRTTTAEATEDDIEVEPEPEKPQEPTILEDLMLQAEIFLQYSMRSKAVERLERINKLFPREEEKHEKLLSLFNAAGFTPKYEDASQAQQATSTAVNNENAVDNFARVTEITRNIARQSSIKSVLFTTVNDVGRHWNVSRCVAGLSAPGKPPSAAMEYCASGVPKSDVMGLARLISTLQTQAVAAGGPVSFEKAQTAPELSSIRQVLIAQKIESLIAVPMKDGDEHIGIVILEQCGNARIFRKVDQIVLNTISEQIVIAVNNARLRSLVKSLAPTDEKSGLLRRSSYLDVLLSEVQRSLQTKSPVTVVLMNFGSASALVKEVGEPTVEFAMQEVGHVVTANIRQSDLAVRYGLTTIALILSDTTDKNAFFVIDKLRKKTATMRVPGKNDPVTLTAGIAELVMQSKFEAVDIVTEAINRVESALEIARHEGGNSAHALAPMFEANAVSA